MQLLQEYPDIYQKTKTGCSSSNMHAEYDTVCNQSMPNQSMIDGYFLPSLLGIIRIADIRM